MSENSTHPHLSRQVQGLPLPIGLLDLDSGLIVAISDTALEFGHLRADEVLEHSVLDRIHPDHRSGMAAALQSMARGSVDLFRAQPLLSTEPVRLVVTWVRRLDVDDRRLALFEMAGDSSHVDGPLAAYLGREPFQMAVGLLDESGTVTRMSTSIAKILDVEADAVVGRDLISMVQREDADHVRQAITHAGSDEAVGVRVRLRNALGESTPVHLIVVSLLGPSAIHGFIVTPAPDRGEQNDSRVADLEQHLWNIAGEVEAAGILMGIGAVAGPALGPDRAALTPRQWEVLGRLLQGERVPTIAEEMFLSQSTVRTHVGSIMKRFGVRTQPELLKLLRTGAPSA